MQKQNMSEDERSELAGQILRATRSSPDATLVVAYPGLPPDTAGMNEKSAQKIAADYADRVEMYAAYLLSKPTSALTQDEQKFLWSELGKFRKGE